MALHFSSSNFTTTINNNSHSHYSYTHTSLSSPSSSSSPFSSLHFNLSISSFHSKLITKLSLQHQETQEKQENQEKSTPSRNKVWVNPKSSKAKLLHQRSDSVRYTSLLKLSDSLNNIACANGRNSGTNGSVSEINVDILQSVNEVLSELGSNPSEYDSVIVLNNVKDPEIAIVALKCLRDKIHKNERKASKREVVMWNVVFKVFRNSRRFDKVEGLFNEMVNEREVKPDNVTFSTIISCARACGMAEKTVEWFEKMKGYGCEPDMVTYGTMIDAYGRVGNVEMALSLYDRARSKKWRIDLVTFTTLIRIYGASENFDGVLNVYEEMKSLGVKPNLVTYNTLLDAMGRAKRPWQVKALYKEMVKNGFIPSWATYASLVRAFCKARHGEDAFKIYKEMKAKGFDLNVVLYNTLLATCADVGYVDEAVEVYEDLKRSETCKPDSWTFSSMITVYSCSGKVLEAENILNEMLEAGLEPNIFMLTSIAQCYGKANRTDDVVKTFNRLQDSGITPDDWFVGCLLNVMTQTPKEELGKLIACIESANPGLGDLVKHLISEEANFEVLKEEATLVCDGISKGVRKAYWNSLIDLCVNHKLFERTCVLFDLALTLDIYTSTQSKSPTQWFLNLKSLSKGAALSALRLWMNDLSKALESGEELPPKLGISTGNGKHKYSGQGITTIIVSHLKELNAPFHEAPGKVGWFLTTNIAVKSWLESRNSLEPVPIPS